MRQEEGQIVDSDRGVQEWLGELVPGLEVSQSLVFHDEKNDNLLKRRRPTEQTLNATVRGS